MLRSIGCQGHDGDIATASYCEGCGHREGCLGKFMTFASSFRFPRVTVGLLSALVVWLVGWFCRGGSVQCGPEASGLCFFHTLQSESITFHMWKTKKADENTEEVLLLDWHDVSDHVSRRSSMCSIPPTFEVGPGSASQLYHILLQEACGILGLPSLQDGTCSRILAFACDLPRT